MEPNWADTLALLWQEYRGRHFGYETADRLDWNQEAVTGGANTARYKLSGQPWPLQSDHARIDEGALRGWLEHRFRINRRSWTGGFLSYEIEHRVS